MDRYPVLDLDEDDDDEDLSDFFEFEVDPYDPDIEAAALMLLTSGGYVTVH